MEIIKREPPPVEPPPATYDIVGLTGEEFDALAKIALYGYLDQRIPQGDTIFYRVQRAIDGAYYEHRRPKSRP